MDADPGDPADTRREDDALTMPYIQPHERQRLDPFLERLIAEMSVVPTMGELNYVITRLLLQSRPTEYAHYNALIGVLECVKLELYRRAVARYEDTKIAANGDVYE